VGTPEVSSSVVGAVADSSVPLDSSGVTPAGGSRSATSSSVDEGTADDASAPSPTIDRDDSVAVDLDRSSSNLDVVVADPRDPAAGPAVAGGADLETQRRHTGAVTMLGLLSTAVVGAGLGLRERAIVRRRAQ
jgi:hypothetical protein